MDKNILLLIGLFLFPLHSFADNFLFVPDGEKQSQNEDFEFSFSLAGEKLFKKKSEKFKDSYLIILPQGKNVRSEIAKYAELVSISPSKKLAVVKISSATKQEQLASFLHSKSHACGNIVLLDNEAGELRTKSLANPLLPIIQNQPHPKIASALESVSDENIRASMMTMQSWESRYHANEVGKETALKLGGIYQNLIPADRNDVDIELFTHSRTAQKSLVVRIRGSDRAGEVLVLGSHLDAINRSTSNKFTPGADDNASGTSTNIEIFRMLMQSKIKPKRTIEIHAYAAEEIGLVGSGEIAKKYKQDAKNVIAMLQFDMNAYSKTEQAKIWLVSNGTNAELNSQLEKLIALYQNVPFAQKPLYAGSSDHASWQKNGFPAAFPTEDPSNFNRALHTSRDTVDVAHNFAQSAAHAKLGLSFLLHYAGM